jgi:hypothetical protein
MFTEPPKSYSETFVVWNDKINLIGACIPLDKGKASVCGTVRFKDGEKVSFYSKSCDCELLHRKLISLCRFVAKFYGTNVTCRKSCVENSTDETSHSLIESFSLN